MTNEELTIIVLDKLNWFFEDLARPPFGSFKGWTKGQLVELILEYETGPQVCKYYGCGQQTFNRTVKELLEPLFGKLNGGNETWKFKLLDFIEYKKCSACGNYKSYSEYHKDISRSNGIHHACKECRVLENASSYKKDSIKEAHKRSYEKNYSIILARNIAYKGERGKRVPKWADLDSISKIYRECPKDMHVDHELPLKGELVSGLHVVDNLQYLTIEENLKKSNKIDLIEYNKRVYNS